MTQINTVRRFHQSRQGQKRLKLLLVSLAAIAICAWRATTGTPRRSMPTRAKTSDPPPRRRAQPRPSPETPPWPPSTASASLATNWPGSAGHYGQEVLEAMVNKCLITAGMPAAGHQRHRARKSTRKSSGWPSASRCPSTSG